MPVSACQRGMETARTPTPEKTVAYYRQLRLGRSAFFQSCFNLRAGLYAIKPSVVMGKRYINLCANLRGLHASRRNVGTMDFLLAIDWIIL
ncbi:hypothetical protein DBV23_07255 [Edwardsiella ictaluri]|nr:hypothetical protein B6E78_11965 [Edwardsiella ictaluri]AVZ82081.1 hypothetical protein DBV23_07255 [Edwardsiella ictaluri]KMQ77035.1 hypothetical protein ABY58_16845 [Edwardsiella ictaluri]KOO53973.1 hypothetical protein ACS33_16910 [Edwardsiella ictaluri]